MQTGPSAVEREAHLVDITDEMIPRVSAGCWREMAYEDARSFRNPGGFTRAGRQLPQSRWFYVRGIRQPC